MKAASDIDNNPATISEATYIHSILCQIGFPHSKVSESTFERECGGASLLIEAGHIWNGEGFVLQQVPYGALPRLILAWINHYAVFYQTNEIHVGKTPSQFLKMLGKSVTGGKNGTINNFKRQMLALSACSVTLGINAKGHAHTFSTKLIKQFDAWQSNIVWPDKLILSDEYTKSLLDRRAVPLDWRAYLALSRSSLRMDIYAWAAVRFPKVTREDPIHWASLKKQFGQEYSWKDGDKDFKAEFKAALEDVKIVYPGAQYTWVNTGILLLPSEPPIPFS